MLGGSVRLILSEGIEFTGVLREDTTFIIGLKDLFRKYDITEDYILFFEFIRASTFFVSIYDRLAMEIFNTHEDKLLVDDVVGSLQGMYYIAGYSF